jgi:hypothetical protein
MLPSLDPPTQPVFFPVQSCSNIHHSTHSVNHISDFSTYVFHSLPNNKSYTFSSNLSSDETHLAIYVHYPFYNLNLYILLSTLGLVAFRFFYDVDLSTAFYYSTLHTPLLITNEFDNLTDNSDPSVDDPQYSDSSDSEDSEFDLHSVLGALSESTTDSHLQFNADEQEDSYYQLYQEDNGFYATIDHYELNQRLGILPFLLLPDVPPTQRLQQQAPHSNYWLNNDADTALDNQQAQPSLFMLSTTSFDQHRKRKAETCGQPLTVLPPEDAQLTPYYYARKDNGSFRPGTPFTNSGLMLQRHTRCINDIPQDKDFFFTIVPHSHAHYLLEPDDIYAEHRLAPLVDERSFHLTHQFDTPDMTSYIYTHRVTFQTLHFCRQHQHRNPQYPRRAMANDYRHCKPFVHQHHPLHQHFSYMVHPPQTRNQHATETTIWPSIDRSFEHRFQLPRIHAVDDAKSTQIEEWLPNRYHDYSHFHITTNNIQVMTMLTLCALDPTIKKSQFHILESCYNVNETSSKTFCRAFFNPLDPPRAIWNLLGTDWIDNSYFPNEEADPVGAHATIVLSVAPNVTPLGPYTFAQQFRHHITQKPRRLFADKTNLAESPSRRCMKHMPCSQLNWPPDLLAIERYDWPNHLCFSPRALTLQPPAYIPYPFNNTSGARYNFFPYQVVQQPIFVQDDLDQHHHVISSWPPNTTF